MRCKKGIAILLALLLACSASASFNAQASVQYDCFLPQPSHLFSARFDCLWGNENGVNFGFVSTLGYGFEHYTQNGSNAMVYGPAISIGPEMQYRFLNGIELSASIKATVDYALFPTILRAEADLDIKYRIKKLIAGIGAGFLFPEKEMALHAILGVCL